jgi:hypothetical protein
VIAIFPPKCPPDQNTPKRKTKYPQKYPHQRVASIVPRRAVKEKKYFVFSELIG